MALWRDARGHMRISARSSSAPEHKLALQRRRRDQSKRLRRSFSIAQINSFEQ
jgi:hypothetical protein